MMLKNKTVVERRKYLHRQAGGSHNFTYKFNFTKVFRKLSIRLFSFLIKHRTFAHSLKGGALVLADTGFRGTARGGPTFPCL